MTFLRTDTRVGCPGRLRLIGWGESFFDVIVLFMDL